MQTAEKLPKLSEIRRIPEFKLLKPTQLRFLSALLRNDLVVERASSDCGIDWRQHYYWMNKPAYKQAYDKTRDLIGDLLESTMLSDAIDGRVAPIVYKGAVSGYIREVNSSERITLLKGFKAQYRDSYNPQGNSAPIALSITYPGQPTIDITQQPQPVVIEDKSK